MLGLGRVGGMEGGEGENYGVVPLGKEEGQKSVFTMAFLGFRWGESMVKNLET